MKAAISSAIQNAINSYHMVLSGQDVNLTANLNKFNISIDNKQLIFYGPADNNQNAALRVDLQDYDLSQIEKILNSLLSACLNLELAFFNSNLINLNLNKSQLLVNELDKLKDYLEIESSIELHGLLPVTRYTCKLTPYAKRIEAEPERQNVQSVDQKVCDAPIQHQIKPHLVRILEQSSDGGDRNLCPIPEIPTMDSAATEGPSETFPMPEVSEVSIVEAILIIKNEPLEKQKVQATEDTIDKIDKTGPFSGPKPIILVNKNTQLADNPKAQPAIDNPRAQVEQWAKDPLGKGYHDLFAKKPKNLTVYELTAHYYNRCKTQYDEIIKIYQAIKTGTEKIQLLLQQNKEDMDQAAMGKALERLKNQYCELQGKKISFINSDELNYFTSEKTQLVHNMKLVLGREFDKINYIAHQLHTFLNSIINNGITDSALRGSLQNAIRAYANIKGNNHQRTHACHVFIKKIWKIVE
jgi:hypothetical protein